VKVRTDGDRLLVMTNSGQTTLKEAYAYTMDAVGHASAVARSGPCVDTR
jgi:hypothetical protein